MNDVTQTNSTNTVSTKTRKRTVKAPKTLFATIDPVYGIIDTASKKKNLSTPLDGESIVKYVLAPVAAKTSKQRVGGLKKRGQ